MKRYKQRKYNTIGKGRKGSDTKKEMERKKRGKIKAKRRY